MRAARIRPAGGALFVSVALVIALVAGPPMAGAATVTREWRAKVGSSGANGSATVQGYTTGAGATVLKLVKLKPSTLLPVMISKGTCAAVGSTVVKLPSVKSSSTGAVSKTLGLTAAQVTAIKNASAAGKMAFRVGSGSTLKCGVFTVIPKPPVVGATITVGAYPTDVAVTAGGVFVANSHDWAISKVDAATNSVLSTFDLPLSGIAGLQALASTEGAIWAAVGFRDANGNELPGSVLRLDPASGQVIATVALAMDPWDMATSPGALWVTSYMDDTITRIDTATNQITNKIVLVGSGPMGIAFDFGSLWVTAADQAKVYRIDPVTYQVAATIATVAAPVGLTTGAGAVWVTNYGTENQPDGLLTRIDPATNQVVRTVPVGGNPLVVAYGGGFVWVPLQGEPTVVQVSATSSAVQARVTLGGKPHGIAATDTSVWVTVPVAPPDPNSPTPPGTLVRIYY